MQENAIKTILSHNYHQNYGHLQKYINIFVFIIYNNLEKFIKILKNDENICKPQ